MPDKDAMAAKLDKAKKIMDWALKSESAPRINAMLDLARSEPGIPILPEQLNRDPWLLNLPNGTLDLRTGQLRDHRREDYITRLCPTKWDPNAICPTWLRTLRAIFPEPQAWKERRYAEATEQGDKELIDFWQRLMGYCLTGNVQEQILAILWGVGSNGKTTVVKTMMEILGTDYAIKVAQEFLTTRKGERHPTELADLFGIRVAVASETSQGARLNEPLVKDLTGGERIRARRMKEDFWEFDATHKVLLQTNHKPCITGTDKGIRRRIVLVPFEAYFWNPDEPADVAKGLPECLKQDKQLPAKLSAEYPAILAWMAVGCLEWQQGGLRIPDRVSAATVDYLAGEDVLAQFLAECCHVKQEDPSYRIKQTFLYAAYQKWCEQSGGVPLTYRAFGDTLAERGFEKYTNNGTWLKGLVLLPTDEGDATEGS